jgi:CheY-like chemotaxis protein
MGKRTAGRATGPSDGLGAIIREVLGKVASPDACASLIARALQRAKLGKLPDDPVLLLAFASGALREVSGQDFGEETAEELLGDVRPILERAAEHAVAMEQAAERAAAEQAAAEQAAAEQAAAERAAAEQEAAERAAAKQAAASGRAKSAGAERTRTTKPGMKLDKNKRKTWPHGKAPAAKDAAIDAAKAPTAAGPPATVKRGASDPKRTTLTYQSTADEFADGLSDGKATVVVVDRDEALRTTLARMLRREGWAVVTAPDAELGLTLCIRVRAKVAIYDASATGLGTRLHERLGERAPHIVALVSGSSPPEIAPVADRVLTKPIAPEQLLAALEGLLPEASRR